LIKPGTVEISGTGKSSNEGHHWYLASVSILLLLTLLPLIGPSMEKLAIFLAGALPMALVAFLLSRIGIQRDKTKKTPWRIEFGVLLLLWFSCLLLKPLFHLVASGQNENTVIVIRELGPILVAVIIGRLTLYQVTKIIHKK
jgi:membrane protease YdiL (CAAX protease family)